MKDFVFREHAGLPALAWCAVVDRSCRKAVVHHGKAVETASNWFIDGAWNAAFDQGRISSATVVCGTGGEIRDGETCFVSSTDRLCPIFTIIKDGLIHVSNSHVFIMELCGEEPDATHPFYYYDLVRIARLGLLAMDGSVRLASGIRMGVHFSCILSIGADGEVSFRPTVDNPRPTDFRVYADLMSGELKRLLQNASDARRKVSFGSVVPLSMGYDTNATAAMAARAGCKKAYTFYDPRREPSENDSGLAHAAYFGLECEEVSRLAYRDEPSLNEAEFCLMGLSSQAPLAAIEHLLERRILLCGNTSNLSWIPKYCRTSDRRAELCSTFISGLSQAEFRLRVGYVPFCPSSIGVEHNRDIFRIHMSEEMKPWSIGGKYDRPVPRRIAEEAGLPREMFGMKKLGGGHQVFRSADAFSPQGWKRYQAYLRRIEASEGKPSILASKLHLFLTQAFWRITGVARRKPRPLNWWTRRFGFIRGTHPMILPWELLLTFQWGVSELRSRYVISRPDSETEQSAGSGSST
jgi:hypothetical protein